MANFPVLMINSNGWSNTLNRSYFAGPYQPKTEEEFNELRQYADPVEDPDEEDGDGDWTVKSLKARLGELGISIPRNANKAELILLLPEEER